MPTFFKGLYRFGEFELNPSGRVFKRNGAPVLISPRAFEVLICLVTNAGRLVTKEELLKAVWPDSFVEESNLTQHISLLRKALGDKSHYIVTVPGRGYQFTAKVQADVPAEFPAAKQRGDILVQRVRERTHVVIEESSPSSGSVSEAVSTSFSPTSLDLISKPRISPRPRSWMIIAALTATVVLALVAGYFSYEKWGRAPTPQAIPIAVLPFTNLTGDPGKEYLSDGVTEEMINALARAEAGQLRVIARATSMSYKSTRKTAQEIARELHVQYVLEGSVQSERDHLHVTAQLVRGNDQSYVWADTFDGDAGQILEFENHLTDSIAHSLSLTLLAGNATEHIPINSATHDAYLQGLYYLSQRTRPGFEDALRSFGSAVAQDPHYARAFAELAVTYNLMGQYNWMDTPQAYSQAQAAAQQAIATDAKLAEAHAAMGFNRWFYEWDAAGAEEELLRAIQLEPTNVDARHWYASVLMTSRRWDDAEMQMRAALALDPKALILRTNLGWLHYLHRQYPLAIEEMLSVLKENPDFITAHYKLWWVYSVTGDIPHAWSELRTLAHLMFTPEHERTIVAVYEKEGYAAALKAMVSFKGGYYWEGLVDDARCMTFAGDNASAFDFLERARKAREGWMVFLETDPAFDPLRSDPEYPRLVRELHSVSKPSL